MTKTLDFSDAHALVLGDLMLDRYYFGAVKRISPEAPVPVVKVKKVKETLGGAGNVLNNLSHLHAHSCLIGVAGNDDSRSKLVELMAALRVRTHLFDSDRPTTTKIRVIGEHQQVVRVDLEEEKEVDGELLDRMKTAIDEEMERCGVAIISDYGKGVCTDAACRYFIDRARERGVPVIVDPKGEDWSKYSGATIITPNVNELCVVAGRAIANEDKALEAAAKKIREKYGIQHLIVTRAEKGMSLVSADRALHVPTDAREVYDVSGAGDTVVSALAASIAVGNNLGDSMKLANKAAGIVVTKMGTAPIEYQELIHSDAPGNHKLMTAQNMMNKLVNDKKAYRIILMEGGFTTLDKALLLKLKEAKTAGDILVIGLLENKDDRAYILSCLEFTDYVINYETDPKTPAEIRAVINADKVISADK